MVVLGKGTSFEALFVAFFLVVAIVHLTTGDLPSLSPEIDILSESVATKPPKSSESDPCKVCRTLVRSFDRGLRDTARGKFDGGDAHWEESRLGSYADSEVRLTEIQENLCRDASSGQDQCHRLAEESEHTIEKWWFNERKKGYSLDEVLCVEYKKVCCPWSFYGPECTPCPTCNRNGRCIGNGTRLGTGGCDCSSGYSGNECNECASGFYQKSSDPLVCTSCDKSCLDHCRFGGPKGCEVCREGYFWDPDYGCLDVDECVEMGRNPCEKNSFCVNTEGSYFCFQCDKACKGCNGDGPDTCTTCAEGYELKDGVCTDTQIEKQEKAFEMSRYVTYLGLCVATCIIFRNNIYIASVIGVVVATYIAVAEYTVTESPLLSPIEQSLKRVLTT